MPRTTAAARASRAPCPPARRRLPILRPGPVVIVILYCTITITITITIP